jgi:hypothetical protein
MKEKSEAKGAIWTTIQLPWTTREKTSRARLSPPRR